jgi:hypothetical protein
MTIFDDFSSLYQTFPLRAPVSNSTELASIQEVFSLVEAGDGRTGGAQGAYQAAALGITLLIAITAGALTGYHPLQLILLVF